MIRKVSRPSCVSLCASARGKLCCYASRFWSFGCGEQKSDEYQDVHAIIAISVRYWLARTSFVHMLFLLALSILPVKQPEYFALYLSSWSTSQFQIRPSVADKDTNFSAALFTYRIAVLFFLRFFSPWDLYIFVFFDRHVLYDRLDWRFSKKSLVKF
jgi:hypothetical protein